MHLPDLDASQLASLDPADEAQVVALAEKLTGRCCPAAGAIADRVAAVLAGNRVVQALEEFFASPHTIREAAEHLREALPERAEAGPEKIWLEIEAYLLVGSVGDEDHPPRLRPKLHTFFHGVYDVGLCLNPDCRTLVPHGGSECPKCGSAARPAALCRTCGQDFVKLRADPLAADRPAGTGDFFSDERTIFLTHQIRELPEAPGAEDAEDNGERDEVLSDEIYQEQRERGRTPNRRRQRHREDQEAAEQRARRRKARAEARLEGVCVCPGCGRLWEDAESCAGCCRKTVRMWKHEGKLSTCPSCGDIFTRGDIVTPLRTGTAPPLRCSPIITSTTWTGRTGSC